MNDIKTQPIFQFLLFSFVPCSFSQKEQRRSQDGLSVGCIHYFSPLFLLQYSLHQPQLLHAFILFHLIPQSVSFSPTNTTIALSHSLSFPVHCGERSFEQPHVLHLYLTPASAPLFFPLSCLLSSTSSSVPLDFPDCSMLLHMHTQLITQ